jgi:nucleoside-diphosphate-sugar epimerase
MSLTVLVTGANGFVGRRVCAELQRAGAAVRAAVRTAASGEGLPGEIVSVGDLAAATSWSAAVDGVDAVIHLAARVHVMRDTSTDPLAAFRAANVSATEALARAAAVHGVKRFVYVSSIKVNGEATAERAFTPSDTPNPVDAYGVSKWEAEQALRRLAGDKQLEVVVVRPPLVYGPGVGGNFLRLLRLVSAGVPLPLGSVRNARSMVYVENLAHALIACATHARAAGETYLVRDGEDLSTPDLITRLADAVGKKPRLLRIPLSVLGLAGALTGKRAEVERLTGSLRVDSSHLETTLDWSPPYSVGAGIAETARWFESARGPRQ